MADFDFDAWSNLARRSPAAYFRARRRAIGAFIDGHAPAQAARLRDLQEHIDGVRALAGSPAKATRELMGMMEDRLEAMRARVRALQHSADEMDRLRRHLVDLDVHRPPADDGSQ